MPEITLEEAQRLYKLSEEAKEIMLTKFTKDELEGKTKPTQEEFNTFVEEHIFSLIDHSKTIFLDNNKNISNIPTSIIELRNNASGPLFYYNYDQKNPYFRYSYYRVVGILCDRFSLKDGEIQLLMKSLVEKHFNLLGLTPDSIGRAF